MALDDAYFGFGATVYEAEEDVYDAASSCTDLAARHAALLAALHGAAAAADPDRSRAELWPAPGPLDRHARTLAAFQTLCDS